MEILRTENLVKTYGKGDNIVYAVNDVSLSVEQGEFVSIVGASGSGKSTLLHIIGGVDRATSGKVFINNNDITSLSPDKLAIFRRRQVGIVYQFYNLIPILTVEENITLPCDLDKVNVDKERLEYILDLFGIKERRNNLPNQLSGGQQQKASIARAIINNPALLLADEPTGNLDSKSTEDIMDILKKSNKELKQTIVMITHNLEIAKTADRIITVKDGKICEEVR